MPPPHGEPKKGIGRQQCEAAILAHQHIMPSVLMMFIQEIFEVHHLLRVSVRVRLLLWNSQGCNPSPVVRTCACVGSILREHTYLSSSYSVIDDTTSQSVRCAALLAGSHLLREVLCLPAWGA